MERQAAAQQRQLDQQQRAAEKLEALERAAYEVDVFENYLEHVTTLHLDAGPVMEWNTIVCVTVTLDAHSDEIIPDTTKSLLASGKLSERRCP
jgi:hypothetical protein